MIRSRNTSKEKIDLRSRIPPFVYAFTMSKFQAKAGSLELDSQPSEGTSRVHFLGHLLNH